MQRIVRFVSIVKVRSGIVNMIAINLLQNILVTSHVQE
jgi:hypothetical protein